MHHPTLLALQQTEMWRVTLAKYGDRSLSVVPLCLFIVVCCMFMRLFLGCDDGLSAFASVPLALWAHTGRNYVVFLAQFMRLGPWQMLSLDVDACTPHAMRSQKPSASEATGPHGERSSEEL